MKNVLFLSTLESTPWGGSEQLWSDMALRLLDKGHHVMTNTLEWPGLHTKLQQVKENGGELLLRPNIHTNGKFTDSATNKVKDIRWKIKALEFKPDVLIINQGGTFDNAITHLASWIRSLGIPYYIIPNFCPEYGFLEDHLRPFFAEYYNGAAKTFFVSRRNMQVAERLLARTIHNAIVIKNPIRLKSVPAHYPDASTYKMASVARLETTVKGHDLLLEVLGEPQWQQRNFLMNIYGAGDDKGYLEELAAFKGLGEKVFFKGFLNDVVQVWEENHILVMPSRGEGTPLSLLEANFCSRAAVVTDVGGNADVITDGENGFVAEAPVVSCFSKVMERAWEQREQWRKMGEDAREKLDRWHPKDPVEEILALIFG